MDDVVGQGFRLGAPQQERGMDIGVGRGHWPAVKLIAAL